MAQRLNSFILREYRISFLIAIQRDAPSVLHDLESIFVQRLYGLDLERALSKWAKDHHLYPWMLDIARRTMSRWERQPKIARTTWQLPPVQSAASWDDAPFSFSHRSYSPDVDGDLPGYEATIRGVFERTLAKHIGRLQNAQEKSVSGQSGRSLDKVQKRSRDGRDKHVGFDWLALKLAGTSPTIIAREAKVDPAAVVRQIKWAHSVLSIE